MLEYKNIYNKLLNKINLDEKEAFFLMNNIITGKKSNIEISRFLTANVLKELTAKELKGYREAIMSLCKKIKIDKKFIDVCGTGGDGKNTFNISTISSFIIAGAGVPVVKHGNFKFSSSTGSSDILNLLGHRFFENESMVKKSLELTNFSYIHAPIFHPALKIVAPARKMLGIRTVFNLLGPLCNPANPKFQLTGVYSKEILKLYSDFYLEYPEKNVNIIFSNDGYDEVSLTSDITIYKDHKIKNIKLSELGMKKIESKELHGGIDDEESKKIFISILMNKSTEAQKNVVISNAGLAISQFKSIPIIDGIEQARKSLESGKAKEVIKKFLSLKN